MVHVTKGKPKKASFQIDTGNTGFPILFTGDGGFQTPLSAIPIGGGFGAQGFSAVAAKRLHALELGDIRLEEPIAVFAPGTGHHNLANSVLSRFELVFDLARERFMMVPYDDSFRAFEPIQGHGITWANSGCGVEKNVEFVTPGSVSALAGVRKGDQLLRLGEVDVADITGSALNDNKHVRATFRRGNSRFKVWLEGRNIVP